MTCHAYKRNVGIIDYSRSIHSVNTMTLVAINLLSCKYSVTNLVISPLNTLFNPRDILLFVAQSFVIVFVLNTNAEADT